MLLTAILLTLQQQALPPDSYADSATAVLVARARAGRERNERLVTSYTAQVTQRIGVGIRARLRDRMLFRQELAARITWHRDQPSTIEVVGARQAIPVAIRGDHVPEDLEDDVRWLVVNPAEDYLHLIGADEDGFIYPLRDGGERDYRFAAGDTTIITLADGRRIRLLELQVTPRRADWRLVSGALWFDADTYGLVRAAFRPARPYEFRRDAEPEDRKDVPSWVNPSAEVKFVTLEYGLYEARWWMLRYAAIEANGTMGSWLGIPVKFERVYSDYEVQGGTPPDSTSKFRPAGTIRRDSDDPSSPVDSVARKIRRDSIHRVQKECERKAEEEFERAPHRSGRITRGRELGARIRACYRRQSDDSVLVVLVPKDTLALLASPELGAPILDMGSLITEEELRGLGDAIGRIPGRPWGTNVQLPHGVTALLQHARYNRIEGLSLGASGKLDFGKLSVEALGRLGVADLEPNVELGLVRPGTGARLRFGGYHRLAAANPEAKPFGVVNSALALLAQRDDGEYFRTTGVELQGANAASEWWSVRLYAERQRPATVETSFSAGHLFGGDGRFRPNILADTADQAGAQLVLRGTRTVSRSVTLGGELALDGATGDFDYGRASATIRGFLTPPGPLALAIEAAAGTSTGDVPIQGRFFMGGPATLRGYSGAVQQGTAYWRGRVEVGNAFPAVRAMLFSDAGWAGPRGDFGRGRPLLGLGVGASFLDGLVRLDLTRGLRTPVGWRFDFYLDGIL